MKTFRCACNSRIFFENTVCLACRRELGFLPDALTMAPLEANGPEGFTTAHGVYRKCANYLEQGVCNWMVPAASSCSLCQACDLNHVIPDLSDPKNKLLWVEVEKGKRRLVYTLDRLKLPLQSKRDDPQHGLAFDIAADTTSTRVLTGHDDGLITLNIVEAHPVEREKIRLAMKERYRTTLGHFRHEIGHYYWDKLVRDTPQIDRFRELFGDERADYAAALQSHYSAKSHAHYSDSFISDYASAHPWEDFAETFAHYLHMDDTLETANDFGLLPNRADSPGSVDRRIDGLLSVWTELTVALNALNRSMGLADAYPFSISPKVEGKLGFIDALVHS